MPLPCCCVVAQSCRLCATPWTVARQAPLSLGFSRQEYWSGLPFPRPVDLSEQGIEPVSPMSPALGLGRGVNSLPLAPPGKPSSALGLHLSVLGTLLGPVLPLTTVSPGLTLSQEPWAGCLCCSGIMETLRGLSP